MRVRVLGEGEVANSLRGHLSAFSHVAVVDYLPDFTVSFVPAGEQITVDGVDGPLETQMVTALAEAVGTVLVKRAGGNSRDDTIVIGLPGGINTVLVERAIFRALTGGLAKVKRGWWRRRLFAALLFLLVPAVAQAQNVFLVKCHDGTTSFWCSDSVNAALRVNCVIGCGASSFLDSAAFTFGTTSITNMGAVVDDVGTNAVAENSAGTPRMTGQRILYFDLSKTLANTNKLLVTPDSVALPANQSVNVAQVAATATSVNNGTVDAGTQRVTLASNSTGQVTLATGAATIGALTANQSVNLAQVNGATVTTGNGTAAGAQRVSIASDTTGQIKVTDGTTVAGVIVGTTALKEDVASVAGTATATAAAGVQKVGVVGNANAAFDAANNATAPANVLRMGGQLQSGATATAGTAGQLGDFVASLDHVLYARLGGPVPWSCSLDNIGATLTQCQAAPAAGLRDYITDIIIASTNGTAGQFLIRTGTGSNCGTGTASLFPSAATVVRFPYPNNISTVGSTTIHLFTPLQPPAAAAICIICVATNTCTVQMQGITAP